MCVLYVFITVFSNSVIFFFLCMKTAACIYTVCELITSLSMVLKLILLFLVVEIFFYLNLYSNERESIETDMSY